MMQLARTRQELKNLLQDSGEKDWGFVPTMGALHEGHLSLCRRAKEESQRVAMSIFVNPTQFGPKEDFSKYPRPLENDLQKAKDLGVDLLFMPEAGEMYSDADSVVVKENEISRSLCGVHRPGHFQGVCTVVLKLFQLFQPKRAYFGQKDAQQLRIIEKMVEDLFLPVEVVSCPTIREKDGLAMSSRNRYLSEEERENASAIYQALSAAQSEFENGERIAQLLEEKAIAVLNSRKRFELQYLEVRRWSDFKKIQSVETKSLLAIAVVLGKIRLIDNIILEGRA